MRGDGSDASGVLRARSVARAGEAATATLARPNFRCARVVATETETHDAMGDRIASIVMWNDVYRPARARALKVDRTMVDDWVMTDDATDATQWNVGDGDDGRGGSVHRERGRGVGEAVRWTDRSERDATHRARWCAAGGYAREWMRGDDERE